MVITVFFALLLSENDQNIACLMLLPLADRLLVLQMFIANRDMKQLGTAHKVEGVYHDLACKHN